MLSAARRQSVARRFLIAEAETRTWIAALLGTQPLPSLSAFLLSAADGSLLLQAANQLATQAGMATVRPVHALADSYKRVENINGFLQQCRALGVSEDDLFRPLDLFERKNVAAVIVTLHALAACAAERSLEPRLQRIGRVLEFSDADLTVAEASVKGSKAMQRFAGPDNNGDNLSQEQADKPSAPPVPPRHDSPRSGDESSHGNGGWATAVSLLFMLGVSAAWVAMLLQRV